MEYQFQFNVILKHWDLLAYGVWLTIRISLVATGLGVLVGVILAGLQTTKWKIFCFPIRLYIEIIRNTPFLAQLFFIYFGLPSLGIRLQPEQGAIIALVINAGAYATEIMRAGIESIHKGQIEAGYSLGLSWLQVFIHVILMPALKKIYPALTSQFILIMLGSSVISAISAKELTYQANYLQSRTFRSFEVYFIVTLIYLGLSYLFRFLFQTFYNFIFGRKKKVRSSSSASGMNKVEGTVS